MIETVVAVGDLMTAVPSFWNDARWPLAIVVVAAGVWFGLTKLTHGIAKAAGLMIGACFLAAVVFDGPNIAMSIHHTLNRHTGGVTAPVSQYGQ